jgi:hypothetical protein
VLAALAPVVGAPPASADGELFRFADAAIVESSGLVDLGDLVVTANDSGNAPNLYVVDPHTGRTVGITYLHIVSTDIEALTPAPADQGGTPRVWVGDIGDNDHRRPFVSVYLAPVAHRRLDVRPVAYHLVYPDGPHDAESLFTDPSGRLYVVTKGFTGGAVYRAPQHLDPRFGNRLEKVADVPELATDAAMLPDHRHVVIRSYALAGVYTFPGFRRVGSFRLPAERQGEGISVGPGGRILLSSEGVDQPVLEVRVPVGLLAAPSPRAAPVRREHTDHEETAAGVSLTWLWWSLAGVVLVGALGIGLGLRRRRE